MAKRERKRELWHPAEYDAQDIRSIQALARYAMGAERPWPPGGEPPTPTPHDVKRALDWIINQAAMTYDDPFVAGQPDVVNYILGRRSVGRQIVKLMSLRPSILEKQRDGRISESE
jgi:hypothetical protein